jgi:HD-like signal output (HDOD) protein
MAQLTPDQWVERMNQHELASLGATVQRVQRVVGDERSSFRHLTEVVLRDAALSTKLLQIANSPIYTLSSDPVTTITRATSMLGFDTIRGICITSRLLDALLANGDLSPGIAERLMNRAASSLHAALQARMFMSGGDQREREEVFLAALLYKVGESAFWSFDCKESKALDIALHKPGCIEEELVLEHVGCSFAALSAALVRSWGLGEAVELVANDVNSRSSQIIRLANTVSDLVAVDGWQPGRLQHCYEQAAELMNQSVEDASHRMRACTKEAQELAVCYGVGMLAKRMIKRGELAHRSTAEVPEAQPSRGRGDASVQMRALRDMAAMSTQKPDINTVLQAAMDGVHGGIGMDRTITALLTPDRGTLQTRLWLGDGGREWSAQFRFPVSTGKNVFFEAVANRSFARFNSAAQGRLLRMIPRELLQFCEARDFVMGPIVVGRRAIGIIYADRTPSGRAIGDEDFAAFQNITQQLGICLTSVTRQRV